LGCRAIELTVLFAPNNKKPVLLDWNKETQFDHYGQQASANELQQGAPVVISYRRVSFHNSLLTKVAWAGKSRDEIPNDSRSNAGRRC